MVKARREQVVGQTVALPTTMVVFAAMGILITSAAVVVFPQYESCRCMGSRQTRRAILAAGRGGDLDVHGGGCNAVGQYRRERRLARKRFCQRFSKAHLIPHGRPDHGNNRDYDACHGNCLPIRAVIFLAGSLAIRGGLGSIAGVLIADYWLVRKQGTNTRRSLSKQRDLWRLELASSICDAFGLLFCVDRVDNSKSQSALRLCVVCRVWRGIFCALGADGGYTAER